MNAEDTKRFLEIDAGGAKIKLQPSSNWTINPTNQSELRILTYNIFLRPPFIKNNRNDHKNSRAAEFLHHINKFDIICLQEAFGFWNERKQELIKFSQRAGFYFYAESPNPPVFSSYLIDGGLLVVSRFPIVESRFCSYPYGVLADALSMKGVLYVKIAVENTFIHLFTTHTQASYADYRDPVTIITRGDQALLFRKFIDEMISIHYGGPHEMVLLLGDFNVNSIDPIKSLINIEGDYTPLRPYPFLRKNGYFDEYESLITCLSKNNKDKLINLMYDHFGQFLPTYGTYEVNREGKKVPKETVLTDAEDSCSNQCLDYIFQLIPNGSGSQKKETDFLNCKNQKRLRIKNKGTEIEKFYVEHAKFTQLSDHLGISTIIAIN